MTTSLPNLIQEAEKNEKTQRKKNKILFVSFLTLFILGSAVSFVVYQTYKPTPTYVWSNLTESLKDQILKRKVNFQGENVVLKDLLGINLKAMDFLTNEEIQNLIDGKNLKRKFLNEKKVV